MTPIDPTARNGIDLDAVTTETLAAACRTAAVSSAFADLLNAAAARLLAQASWIDGAKVDLDGYDEARAESQRATAWHMEALDDLAACVAERDDWRRRYEALRADYNHLNERLDFAVETGSKMIKRYGALRDGVTDVAAWLATRCDCTDYGIGSEPCEHQEAANSLRAVVARVEES